MITRIEIDGFKTFNNFIMEFSPFTVIAGTNASGKSNLFDALKLLSNLMNMDVRDAFSDPELRGEVQELFTQFSTAYTSEQIHFAVEMLVDKTITDNWGEEARLKYTRLRYELLIKRTKNDKNFEDLVITEEFLKPVKISEDNWIKNYIPKSLINNWRPSTTGRAVPYISTENKNQKTVFRVHQDNTSRDSKRAGRPRDYIGEFAKQTILSTISNVEFPHAFAAKKEIQNWRFLQLNPEDLRKPSSRMAPDMITPSGANLAAALYRIKKEDESLLKDVSRELNNLLPNFIKVDVAEEISENKYVIKLLTEDDHEFTSRVLSEGTLRLLVLCILKYDEKHRGIICFEEPENGVHPFRLDLMISLLKDLSTDFSDIDESEFPIRQVIVNTHSSAFVGKIFKNLSDSNIASVWFSNMVTSFYKFNGDKFKYKSTRLIPVTGNSIQSSFDFIEQSEKQLTNLEVKKYLETQDFENK